MVDFEDIEVKIELDDLDLDILGDLTTPSMLSIFDNDDGLLQPNAEPQQHDLKYSTIDTRQTQDNEGLIIEQAATPIVGQVQDSAGYLAVATNLTQNTEPTFDITEQANFSRENPPTTLPIVMDNRDFLPQILSDSSAPLAVATIQAQNTESRFDITEPTTLFSWENLSTTLPLVMDDRDLLPQLLPNSRALLLNETQSSYLSPSMNYEINPSRAWDSQRSEPYIQSTLVPVPSNLYDHQHAYRAMLPEPPFPPRFDIQSNQYHSLGMMPNGHVEQGVGGTMQLSRGTERASDIQLQQMAPITANRVTTLWKGKNVQYEQPRRGRPPKRREAGESSSCLRHLKMKKGSPGIKNGGATISQEANRNTNLRNPSYAPNARVFVNGLYGSAFERNGLPPDPHLRLFRAQSGRK